MPSPGTDSDPVPVREASSARPSPETEDAQTAVAPEAPPDTNLGRADRDRATDTVQPQNNHDSNNYDGQWNDSGWSRWGDRSARSWGNDWTGRDRQWDVDWTSGWDRRTSWDATTAATSGYGDSRHKNGGDDPWSNGKDPWSRGAEDGGQHRDHGRLGPHDGPWADGRAGRGQGSDSGERGPASWNGSASHEESGVAWNGWAHYDQGGFQGGDDDRRVSKSNGRASERLTVPTFSGEDTDDVGGSARSYLRQIEAWRRMTYLPPAQQGLVLYQNLSGKAWIAAEELSVPRLGADGGVSYFVSWVNTRFLDIEVARIGKAFSDFFRRLKRRQGQTIREYNSEYDRLHARLREVGCSIPQECAAWLYIDRLQLEEAQELNLLASVGNEYNLHRLQKAAVLHDRGHRKPWENGRSRKPHTAHITHAAEDRDGDDQDHELAADSDLEDGVSEEVAVAYATYQSAKDRYREQSRNRGYRGGRTTDSDKGNDDKAELTKDQKVKLMKSRSFCSSCGRKGHWHRDPECPNNGQSSGTKAVKEIEVCHHVAAEVFSLRHEGPALLGITDTACARSVAGTMWLQQYSDALERVFKKPDLIKENEAFRFGTGKIHHSSFCVIVYFQFGDKVVEMRTSIINGDVPLLMSKQALGQLGMIFNVAENRADFTRVGVRNLDLVTTSSGHPAICITPAKPATGPQRLVLEESGASTGSQYMAYAVSVAHLQGSTDYATSPSGPSTATESTTSSSSTTEPTIATSTTKAPPFKIFYDKKLSPEVKELLTQDRLQEVSFMGWWEATKVNSDFWLEGDTAWHRIHVVPRRALCNPSTWKTQHTMQKEMLLKSIGDLRTTEGFCCRTNKPLEIAVDRWQDDQVENAFPLLWVGRSSFAKVRSEPQDSFASQEPQHGMQTPGHLQDEQDGALVGMQPAGPGGASLMDERGAQGHHHGAQDERPADAAGGHHEVGEQSHARRVEGEGRLPQRDVPGEDHQGQPVAPHPRRGLHPRNGADEDREVQGVRVPGDPATVWNVGGRGGQDVAKPTCGAREVRQMVGRARVPGPLRQGQLPGRERYGPLPCGRLEEAGIYDVGWMGPSHRAQQGLNRTRPANRPEDEQKGSVEFRLRSGGDEGDGDRDRPRDLGGDSRARDQARDAQAEGQGGARTAEGGKVNGDDGLSIGRLAPIEEATESEDAYDDHGGRDERLRHLLQDQDRLQGQVHPGPRHAERVPGEEQHEYKFEGDQFGNKTYEHSKGCCRGGAEIAEHESYITDEEFSMSVVKHTTNYPCAVTSPTKENGFTTAYNNQDFSYETLLILLNTLDRNPVKATRDGVFGGKTGDPVHYYTYGMFSHGGVVGITTRTKENDNVVRYLNAFARYHLGPHATWTSISVSLNTSTEVHHDFHNYKGTSNYTVSLGQARGGGLWIEDKNVEENSSKEGIKWRKTNGGQWLPGRVHPTNKEFVEFDPFLARNRAMERN